MNKYVLFALITFAVLFHLDTQAPEMPPADMPAENLPTDTNNGPEEKNNTWTRLKTDAYYMGDGLTYVLSSPIRWKGKDWLKVGGVLGGVFLVSFIDQPFQDWAEDTYDEDRWHRIEDFADLTGKPGPYSNRLFGALTD